MSKQRNAKKDNVQRIDWNKFLVFYTTITLIKVCQRLKNNTKYMNSEAIKVTWNNSKCTI